MIQDKDYSKIFLLWSKKHSREGKAQYRELWWENWILGYSKLDADDKKNTAQSLDNYEDTYSDQKTYKNSSYYWSYIHKTCGSYNEFAVHDWHYNLQANNDNTKNEIIPSW